ncbi:MAG: molybdopterin-dependent oxidoreductase [Acidobacteria bacterium]|nr:molybdopterin-dependent oxidoreductase [Acidobacteriota bacterium]NIM62744.1 molybdopterin-dependent oxidoreductase [Acidobacteriota bacterium]NIO59044.1 molybdopterin-dependent oxidoreductase [Acidobacteriota bacterium]NIQ30083.1 molybdopterin-dependent oxidoreductase [Acidobacteriota bacterium]NIQ84886.1 molybdopterin-dependent oxidoreductase [Acidobacteriota bacterium]
MADVTFTLDGSTVTGRRGQTILQVMQAHQRNVPNLCNDPRLDPYGGCRTCVVEVEGSPRPVPACATPIAEGMVVRSESGPVEDYRKTLVELLMMEHLGGEGDGVGHDDLALLARDYDVEPLFELPSHRRPYKDRNEFIGLDADNCILCNRCVRYCEEVMLCSALTLTGKGPGGHIQPTRGESFLDTDCELCGGCVSTCPTGALYDKRALGTQDTQVAKTTTTCTYCGVGCQLDLHVEDNKIVKVGTRIGAPVSEGNLCVKGRFAFDFVDHPDRLKMPLVRNDAGELVEASWDDALDRVAEGLNGVRERHGSQKLAFLTSSRCTNEENYLLQKLARGVMGTNSVHSCAAT